MGTRVAGLLTVWVAAEVATSLLPSGGSGRASISVCCVGADVLGACCCLRGGSGVGEDCAKGLRIDGVGADVLGACCCLRGDCGLTVREWMWGFTWQLGDVGGGMGGDGGGGRGRGGMKVVEPVFSLGGVLGSGGPARLAGWVQWWRLGRRWKRGGRWK